MKRILKLSFLLLAFLLPATANAYDFEVDGIYYSTHGNEASVCCNWADYEFEYVGSYSGEVIIPVTFTYYGTTYTVTSIDDHAFLACWNLTSVTIPNTVTSIGEMAFYDCSSLTSITIPNSVTSIGGSAFERCTGLNSVYITDLSAWCKIDFNNGTSNPCHEANHLYIYGQEITDLIIPDDVTSISNYAFYGCSELTSVTIPNSVTSIGDYAFYTCSSLTSIDIPNSVTTIGSGAFSDCWRLTSITIPNSVTTIGYEAFYDCNRLTSIDIPNSVISIGEGAFESCNSLTSVTIPNSVTSIGNGAFSDCWKLTSIQVESGNSTYDSRSNCNAIIETASNTLITGCKNTIIPNSVTSIGYKAFNGCDGLTSIDIPNSVTTIGYSAFGGCTGLTNVTIGNSVTSIGSSAFSSCYKLTSIDFPNSVTSIGYYAFNYCTGLTSITIPNSVTSIDFCAFYGCTSLNDVYSYITDPTEITMGSSVFYQSSNNYDVRTLHVPAGSLAAYQADTKWSQYFGSIIEMDAILATSVELDCESVELTEGETLQLTATVLPEDATNKSVTWAMSDEAVATVAQNGLVTALATGTAIITATTNDGSELSATCVVNVTSPAMPPTVENQFVVTNISAKHGDVVVIPVALINSQTFAAFQTDVFLPEGFSIVTDEDDEYLVTPSERLTSDHVLMTNDANNGSVRVLCYTPNALPISGSEGELFFITVQVPNDAEGTYTIALRNSLLTTAEYQEISIPDAEGQMEIYAFIPGDVNDSRTVTVTDIVIAAQYVLDMNPDPFIFEAADMNGDGNVTVTDIMLIAYLINHPTMTAPKRMPILDGSNDYMSGEDLTLMAGETRKVSIQLNNEMDYTAFQMDLTLPAGLTASNFQLTDRAGSHAFDVNTLSSGKMRALCYSPAIGVIHGHEGALLTFDVTATGIIEGFITVDGIELVTAGCQTVLMNSFTIGVNSATSVNELNGDKTVARVEYFNLTGQQIDRPDSGVTLVVTTYTDGTRSTTKVIK